MDVLGSGIVSSGGISNDIHPSGGVISSWGGLCSDRLIMSNGRSFSQGAGTCAAILQAPGSLVASQRGAALVGASFAVHSLVLATA